MCNYLKQPIIFFGFGRCGSTIISEIIFKHHKLAWISNYQEKFPSSTRINLIRNLFDNKLWKLSGQKKQLNEVSLFNKYLFRPHEAYRFWNTITGIDFARSFLHNVEVHEEKRDKVLSVFRDMVRYQNKERLSFKLTGSSRLTYLNSLFPDARYVYIKRNPLPNLRSLLKVEFYQERKYELTWRGVYSEQEKEKLQQWKKNKKAALFAAFQYYKVNEIYQKEKRELNLQKQIFEISYEKFINKPVDVVNDILKFVELGKDDDINKHLNDIDIHNRNRKEDYYISPELDSKIYNIAVEGI